MYPDFVIIGAQKAGSSALMSALKAHPEVHLPGHETRYFRDPWFQFQPPSVLDDEMAGAAVTTRRHGIHCPALLGEPDAPHRLQETLGTPQMIAILREPVARAISSYYHYMRFGLAPIDDPDTGLRRLLDDDAEDYPFAKQVLTYGLYGQHLTRYAEAFGRDPLLVLLDDDLRSERESTITGVLRFLNVSPSSGPSRQSANVGVYSPARLRFLRQRDRYVLGTYPGYPGRYLLGPQTRSARIAVAAIDAVDRTVLARVFGNERPSISDDVRARLTEYYADDTNATEAFLDRDLSAWRSP